MLPPLVPETSASTNSATSAGVSLKRLNDHTVDHHSRAIEPETSSFTSGRLDGLSGRCKDALTIKKTIEMTAAAIASQEILKPHLSVAGGHSLSGTLRVSGAKNSALVLMTASLLTADTLELCNIPDLTDIDGMSQILTSLGVRVERQADRIRLNAAVLSGAEPPYELVNSLRASFFSIGPLLGRLGHAKVPLPGGCRIGARPVVEHIRGLKALGAVIQVQHGIIHANVPGPKKRLQGASIVLDCPSVRPQKPS